jgi:hypothetical protein
MLKKLNTNTKSERMILIWNCVKELGRSTPEVIAKDLAKRLNIDADDKNFKRNIYRDLKGFVNSGILDVEYFTPAGEKIQPGDEDTHPNLRIEYFVPGAISGFPGSGLLAKNGIHFFKQKSNVIDWYASELQNGVADQKFVLLARSLAGRVCGLFADRDQLPIKITFGRFPDDSNAMSAILANIEQQYGLRSSACFTTDSSMSRAGKENRLAHGLIETEKSGDTLKISDLNSSRGTEWAAAPADVLNRVLSLASNDTTLANNENPFSDNGLSWQNVNGTVTGVPMPAFIKFGDFVVLTALT